MNTLEVSPTPRWQRIVWVGAGAGLLATIFTLLAIVGVTVGQVVESFRLKSDTPASVLLSGMSLVTLTLIRLLAVLIGGAIAFAGLAVSFFVHQQAVRLDVGVAEKELGNAKAALATHSPGIVAIVIGALVIVAALFAKATHSYEVRESPSHSAVRSDAPGKLRPIGEVLGKQASEQKSDSP